MNKGSERGKITWVNNNLSPPPKNIYLDTEKYNYAVDENGNPNVLIDDFTKNTIPWEKNGGIAILHTSTKDTIKKLKDIKINKNNS
jgi:hypothetical protein